MRVGAGLYLTLMIGGALGTGVLSLLASNRATQEAAAALPLPMLVMAIAWLMLVYKMWSAIDDGQTSPKPAAAVGLMFIPLFSLFWIFVVLPGWASRYNAYAQRHGLRVQPLSMGLLLAMILLSWIPLVGFVLLIVGVLHVVKAINALADARGAP